MTHKSPQGTKNAWDWSASRHVHAITVTHGGGGTQALVTIDDGDLIETVIVEVTETWDGGAGLAFTVGDGGDSDGFVTDLAGELGVAGYYNLHHGYTGDYSWDSVNKHRRWYIYTGADTVDAFVNAGAGATQGECVVYVVITHLKA